MIQAKSRTGLVAIAVTAALLVALATTASGRTGTDTFPGAPASQRFPEFGRCPLAAANRYLTGRTGCVSVRRADIDGDRRPDLVILYGHLNAKGIATSFTLTVVRASGGVFSTGVPRGDLNATIARIRDVNGRRGAEIFVHESHVTTEEVMGVYTFDGRALIRAGGFPYGGADAGIRFGFTCYTSTPSHIVEHEFLERTPFKGVWERTDTTFRWVGSRLVKGATSRARAKPTPAEVGAHC